VAERPAFRIRTLDIDVYAFACPQHTCGDLACKIVKHAKDWRTACPRETSAQWVSFHLACADWNCTSDRFGIDKPFMLGQAMSALRSLL
jgi:hypothetical protein